MTETPMIGVMDVRGRSLAHRPPTQELCNTPELGYTPPSAPLSEPMSLPRKPTREETLAAAGKTVPDVLAGPDSYSARAYRAPSPPRRTRRRPMPNALWQRLNALIELKSSAERAWHAPAHLAIQPELYGHSVTSVEPWTGRVARQHGSQFTSRGLFWAGYGRSDLCIDGLPHPQRQRR